MIGNLANDPDFRQTKNGKPVVNFPLATNRFTLDEEGNKKETVDFHRVIAWGGLAEICHDYLSKGAAIFVEGKIVNRSYDDQEGKRQFKTEIVAEEVNILRSLKENKGKPEISK